MKSHKKELFKTYFISVSLYMFVCLCIFSGLFFLLINNPDFLSAMQDVVSHDTSLISIWIILIPLYIFISIVAGTAFALIYVEGISSPSIGEKSVTTTNRKTTTTKKRKK